MNVTQSSPGLLRRSFPILGRGVKYHGKVFDALTAASVPGNRAGNDVLVDAA